MQMVAGRQLEFRGNTPAQVQLFSWPQYLFYICYTVRQRASLGEQIPI